VREDPRQHLRCLSCGYPLASAKTLRCPECGTEWTLEAAELDAAKNLTPVQRRHDGFLAILFGFGTPLTLFVAWIIYRTHAAPRDWAMAVLIAMIAFAALMAWFSVECLLASRRGRRSRWYTILYQLLRNDTGIG